MFETAACMADQPVSEIRDFIDRVVEEMDHLPQRLAEAGEEGSPIRIDLDLRLTIDEAVRAKLQRAARQARK